MNLFASSLFLLFTIGAVMADDDSARGIMNIINQNRSEAAHVVGIGNMQKLELDDTLMKAAQEAAKSCDKFKVKNGPNYKLMETKFMASNTPKNMKDVLEHGRFPEGQFCGEFELYIPTRNKFGYGVSICNDNSFGVIAIGPGTAWKYADIKRGEVGSACNPGQSVENRLCVGGNGGDRGCNNGSCGGGAGNVGGPPATTSSSSVFLSQLLSMFLPIVFFL